MPDPRAVAGSLGEQAVDADVFGHEHARVDQRADLLFGLGEEVLPGLPRNCPAVRVDSDDFTVGGGRDLVLVEGTGPDVGLIDAEERGD